MSEPNQVQGTPEEFGTRSIWRDSSGLDGEQAREHAARLELRARAESEIAVRDEYLSLLGVAPGERALDVGCGSGAVTRALARRVGSAGRAVGVDTSSAILAVARELAEREGVGNAVDFRQGDCRSLPFTDASFDVVLAATTLCHVPGPERALAEMVRVTRPGGRVGVFDLDGDMCLYAHPDRELTRRIVAAYADQMLVNGWLVRKLPALLTELGVIGVRTRGFMPLEAGGYYANRAERCADVAAQSGLITPDDRARWLEAHRADVAAGRFLGGQLHLLVWGTRPFTDGKA
ncbi:MAG: methyltransferase domain-containing protein [Betaproteobacteria bacterium]|nr:MAG: methyltransferase domain-containing protein [Betaproteobacteria bacterium]